MYNSVSPSSAQEVRSQKDLCLDSGRGTTSVLNERVYTLCFLATEATTIASVILKSGELELLLPIGRESMDVSLRAAIFPRL